MLPGSPFLVRVRRSVLCSQFRVRRSGVLARVDRCLVTNARATSGRRHRGPHGLFAIVACGQERAASAVPAQWRDPSSQRLQHVTVDDEVRLEVLDWGGAGRAVVLLAGSGNTAHVFDDFAPSLTDCCHVYGITRRGFGASSQPASGYDGQRLADDILEVLDSIGIDDPVLVGHSMAGGEITTIGSQHSDRVAALVYMDALADPVDAPFNDAALCN